MAEIKVLPAALAELIAAGEVIERPASAIKELVENSVDAGATKITVEINRGGISYMRVTDNGCGIPSSQVREAFKRHATSKISKEEDLFGISTLGFRGEALPSISAVARVELLTKTVGEDLGTHYVIEGGVEKLCEEVSCPDGTTIIIRDLFFNTPARMKFLKKDASETLAVASLVDALALSHPEISVRLIRDSKPTLHTAGDGDLKTTVYSVLGREFASGVIPADSTTNGVRVSGLICKPIHCRATRSSQYIFLNNRYIRSGAVTKALDQAYKGSVMVGKFPACVLNIEIAPEKVDVNAHPSKLEVRFSDEKTIFEAVYYAVKNALAKGDTRPELEFKTKTPTPDTAFVKMTVEEYKNLASNKVTKREESVTRLPVFERENKPLPTRVADFNKALISNSPIGIHTVKTNDSLHQKEEPVFDTAPAAKQKHAPIVDEFISIFSDEGQTFENATFLKDDEIDFKYVGEAFRTYIIVQKKSSLFFIDKHAAHERMLYENLKKDGVIEVQTLLSPVSVTLSREEYKAVCDNLDLLHKAGFEIEEFGTVSVIVRAIPAMLSGCDVMNVVLGVAANLVKYGTADNDILDDIYHNIACRAAVKGGNEQSAAELENFARELLSNNDVMYCPHGRPVAFELKKSELERQFGRSK